MSGSSSVYDASASAIGYLYQLRYALWAGLELYESNANWSISVEIVDDVEIISGGSSRRWQLKHRANGTALTNGSTDLWKTLRIWSEGIADGSLDPARTQLMLLTTSTIPAGSAAHYLQADSSRNVLEARKLLAGAAKASESKTNKKGIEAYLTLDPDRQLLPMLEAITAIGGGPNIDDIHGKLLRTCRFAAGSANAESMLNRLEGWFIQRCIETMNVGRVLPITGSEIDEKFTELRHQFPETNLPIDDDIADMTATRDEYADHVFVHQLDLIGISSKRVELAVRDYLRAYTQRSRWSRENLLLPGELGKYDRRLQEEWQTKFAVMEDELGADAAEEAKTKAAKAIYGWVEQEFRRNIRPECHDPFVCKGSFQILADEMLVGWHPDSRPGS